MNKLPGLTAFVTSCCNKDCAYCGQAAWRRARPGYQMTLDEVDCFLQRSRELNVRFDTLMIFGGEPTLWKNLSQGLRRFRRSRLFDQTMVYSKPMDPQGTGAT